MVSFSLVPDQSYESVAASRIDIFTGDRITSLKQVAAADWGTQFFADSGQVYRIRVSHVSKSVPLELKWFVGVRPANDDFLRAAVIEGATGTVVGTNAGATLESETFGSMAGTVWYRWTAPSDGTWEFESDTEQLRVLAFTGEKLSYLRLVSAFPYYRAVLKVREGEEYILTVASQDAYAAGADYELSWDNIEREAGNDDFNNADVIPAEVSSSHHVNIDSDATVEPGEPLESGIRTKWWTWTAPVDGNYTWRIEELTRETTGPGNKLMVSVFVGDSLDELKFVAGNGAAMSVEWVFSAFSGQQYWLSTGFPADYLWAFHQRLHSPEATLEWGLTPTNDAFSSAASLMGLSGSVTASNFFATTERGERTGRLGHSSLWWKYEVPTTGWYRFWIDDDDEALTIALYRADDSLRSLELVDSQLGPGVEVVFPAEEGSVYAIRIGTRGNAPGRQFVLSWEDIVPPLEMRYAGRLLPGGFDAAGNAVELRNLTSLTLNSDGDRLYLASELGLQGFERDAETGALTFEQLIEGSLQGWQLVWDAHRDRLLSLFCFEWRVFTNVGDASSGQLQDAGRLSLSHDHQTCNEQDVFIDSEGTYIYTVAHSPFRLQTFEFMTSDSVEHVQTLEIDGLRAAVLSNNNHHVYALSDSSLLTFERDTETGELAQTASSSLSNGTGLAISSEDEILFVFDNEGPHVRVFGLSEDASRPVVLHKQTEGELNNCARATARDGVTASDVICGYNPRSVDTLGIARTVEWRGDTNELFITKGYSDPNMPEYNEPEFFTPIDIAARPDGRHVYVATYENGILIYERLDN